LGMMYWGYYLIAVCLACAVSHKFWRLAYELFIMKEKNLQQIYGVGSWAVVSGSTDGIGWGFVQELASRHFNIVLLARNEQKVQGRIQELKQ
jgi:17beta-estradiol 17-dehydrogenase / very-long-chain 3-oxoacyl-CoA reductase